MPRGYRHIQEYEKEILELKEQGKTLREIGERLGFSRKQVHDFITRYNEQQRKIAAGIAVFISRSRAGRTCPHTGGISEADPIDQPSIFSSQSMNRSSLWSSRRYLYSSSPHPCSTISSSVYRFTAHARP